MRYRRIALAALTTLALSGIAASTATATETLSFNPLSGKFPVKKVTMKAGVVKFSQGFETSYGCQSLTGEGELTGHKTAKMKLTFKQCGPILPERKCQSTGSKEQGEIVTESLPVELVYTSKAKHEAGLDINYNEPGTGIKQLATWHCGPLNEFGPFGIRGSIISPVTPVNTQTFIYKYKLLEASGLQTPAAYETEAGSLFEAFPETALASSFYAKGAVSTGLNENELAFSASEGKVEIKA